jgi:hypothetical protein
LLEAALANRRVVVRQRSLDLVRPVAFLCFNHQLPHPSLLVLRRAEHHFDRRSLPAVGLQVPALGVHSKIDAGVRGEVGIELSVGFNPVGEFEFDAGGLIDGSDDLEPIVDGRLQESEVTAVRPLAPVFSQYLEVSLQVHGLVGDNCQLEGDLL